MAARFAAIVIVIANAVSHIAFLDAQPIWGLIMVAIDVLVVYALTVRWADVDSCHARAAVAGVAQSTSACSPPTGSARGG